jgi:hypothetical protein
MPQNENQCILTLELEIEKLLIFLNSSVKNIDEIVQKAQFDEMKKLGSGFITRTRPPRLRRKRIGRLWGTGRIG